MPRREPLYPHIPKRKGIPAQPKPPQLMSEIQIVREATDYEKYGHPALPKETTYPVLYTEVHAAIDNIGRITYSIFPSLRVGYIELVYVVASYRGQGLSRRLLEFAIDDMRRRGITKVSAGIWSEEGASLFRSFGFSLMEPDAKQHRQAVKSI